MDHILKRINRHRLKRHFLMIDSKSLSLLPCSITFDDELLYITMFNKQLQIALEDIVEIRQGCRTDHWIKFCLKLEMKKYNSVRYRSMAMRLKDKQSKSFSVILTRQDYPLLCDTYDFYTENFQIFHQEIIFKLNKKILESKQHAKVEKYHKMLELFYQRHIIETNGKTTNDVHSHHNINRFKKFLRYINVDLDCHHLNLIMSKNGRIKSNMMNKSIFLKLMNQLDSRPYFNFLFYKYSLCKSELMSREGLHQFFLVEQQENLNDNELDRLMEEFTDVIEDFNDNDNDNCWNQPPERFLTRSGFYRLMESPKWFDLFDSRHKKVCQDMTRPLTDYFIASSHNTYLSGNQFSSQSSYEMYRKVLLTGCRCIEIDIWDDIGNGGFGTIRPIIYHGYTMTTKIELEGVLETINDVAFETSDYPLIISVENRCKHYENHRHIAKLMRKIFKDRLYVDPVGEGQTKFPSPEELRGKIFIKCFKNELLYNNLKDYSEDFDHHLLLGFWKIYYLSKDRKRHHIESIQRMKSTKYTHNENVVIINNDVEEDDEKYLNRRYRLPIIRFQRRNFIRQQLTKPKVETAMTNDSIVSYLTSSSINDQTELDGNTILSSQKNQCDESFSSLINYFQTRKFHSLEKCLKDFKFYQMISRDERQSRELIDYEFDRYRQFTERNMVRIYPSGWRQDSSNYCPIDHWNVGAQMVALNYQRFSMPMFLNNALFTLNGKCGYVLKPNHLCKKDESLKTIILRVQILCGQFWNHFDTCKKLGLKIVIRIYSGSRKYRQSTQALQNGFNPVWNETFEFKLDSSELTFINFTMTNRDDFFGHYLISFAALRKGFRHISFFDKEYHLIKFTRLFLHIEY